MWKGGSYGGKTGYQGAGYGGKAGYQGAGYQGGWKGGGKTGFVPVSERECYQCGGKGHIAKNCPKAANEVSGPGGAEGEPQQVCHEQAQ